MVGAEFRHRGGFVGHVPVYAAQLTFRQVNHRSVGGHVFKIGVERSIGVGRGDLQ